VAGGREVFVNSSLLFKFYIIYFFAFSRETSSYGSFMFWGTSFFWLFDRGHVFRYFVTLFSNSFYEKKLSIYNFYDNSNIIKYSYAIIIIGRPGIKTKESLQSALNTKMVAAQNELIRKTIFPQIKTLYGTRKGCELL
jgi:hypothetical protein